VTSRDDGCCSSACRLPVGARARGRRGARGQRVDRHEAERLRPADLHQERVRVREQLLLARAADLADEAHARPVEVRRDLARARRPLVRRRARRADRRGPARAERRPTRLRLEVVGLGWELGRDIERALAPPLFDRLEQGTAGAMDFLLRLLTMLAPVVVALRIAGITPRTLALGGVVTAVIVGLAAQQTIGHLIAGTVLLSAHPFRVGEHLRDHISTPIRGAPRITLEELDGDEVVVRIGATPRSPSDGPQLASECARSRRSCASVRTLDRGERRPT
jgi:hypothetical protein